MTRPVACGIDFGTSNSTVAVSDAKGKYLVELEDGYTTLPSALFFQKSKGPLFGRAAIDAYMYGDEGRFMRGLKKILGTSLMEDKTLVGSRSVTFTEILQIFIGHLKAQAENAAGKAIDHVVMGRPVHFHDNDEDADQKSEATLKKITHAAGFKHTEFLFEPIAAAFAHEEKINGEKLALVVDLGGGTSDFTVIRLSRDRMEHDDRREDILSTSGVRIGGTTFDYRIALKNFMPELGMGSQYHDIFEKDKYMRVPNHVYFQLSDWAMVNFAQTKAAISETMDIKKRSRSPKKISRLLKLQQDHLGHALLGEVEKSKIALTDAETVQARFAELDEDFAVSLSRSGFEDTIGDDVARIFGSITECLSLAGVAQEQINLVILTGGSTELPLINRLVREKFPHATISQGNKLDSVGLGLAYRASRIV